MLDPSHEVMFEEGNYRRRRRRPVKKPVTGYPPSYCVASPYATYQPLRADFSRPGGWISGDHAGLPAYSFQGSYQGGMLPQNSLTTAPGFPGTISPFGFQHGVAETHRSAPVISPYPAGSSLSYSQNGLLGPHQEWTSPQCSIPLHRHFPQPLHYGPQPYLECTEMA